jgi:hypothetical protein
VYIRHFRATGRRRTIRVLTNPMNRLRNCDAPTYARIVASLLLLVAVAIVEWQTAQAQVPGATASIAGCVSYYKGDPVPGATIAVKSIGFRRTVQSDASGCYEMTNLTAGSINDEPGLWIDKEKEPYPAVIFRVESGRIQSAPPGASGFVGASRDALFKELRALQ